VDANLTVGGSTTAAAHAELAETLRRSTVQVTAGRFGGGSGVVWRADGLIVTNAHVAHGKRMAIELADGTPLRAELVARDEERDIAALRVDATGLEAARIADSDEVRPGQLAFAVGNPLGLVGAVTSGIVHAAGSHSGRRSRWIQADVRIAPGNSGGPLADARGHVIGVNSMIYGGLAVAVPSNAVERFLRGQAARPRLGVTVEPVQLRTAARTDVLGLLIFEVAAGSPAERAGLLPGDTLIRIAGAPLRDASDLPDALAQSASTGALQLTIVRGGVPQDVSVNVSGRVGADAAA
jgi:serine protease Do